MTGKGARFLAILSVAIVSVVVSACGSSSTGGTSTTPLYVGTYPGIDPYEEQLKASFMAEGAKLGVKVSWLTPTTFDVAQQLTITESALSQPGIAGLSVVAADPNSLEGVMKKAQQKGLGLSQLSACTPQAVAAICYSTDFEKAGATVAQKMGQVMGGSGDVVIATGVPGDTNHQLRIKGFTDYMNQNYPNIKIVQTIANCDSADKTVSCAETALSGHPNLRGYYGTGGQASVGAFTVFSRAHKKVAVAAVDDDPTTIAAIKGSDQYFTYVQAPYCQGIMMVYLPYVMVTKHLKPTQKFFDTGVTIVDSANVNNYQDTVKANCTKLLQDLDTNVMK
ncbi:MAG TPA: substrate-binding domain-containing protein [Candidatus Dormibacteraeota bacterium]|jgi:ribose transport system substrate-binding protein